MRKSGIISALKTSRICIKEDCGYRTMLFIVLKGSVVFHSGKTGKFNILLLVLEYEFKMKITESKWRKTYTFIALFLLISLFSMKLVDIKIVSANPYIVVTVAHGVLLPVNYTHGIEMQNAEVIINIDAKKRGRTALTDYEGNYTFYNTNITQTMLVAAPFVFGVSGIEEKTTVFVDNVQTNYTMMVFRFDNDNNSENYGYDLDFYPEIAVVLCNITFHADVTTEVYYKYESLTVSLNASQTRFDYIVGTANSWSNSSNINEVVELRVKGFQPKAYSENCTKTKITGGQSYLWIWENEQIEVAKVGIYYQYLPWDNLSKFLFALVIAGPVIFIPLIIYVIVKLVRKLKGRIPRKMDWKDVGSLLSELLREKNILATDTKTVPLLSDASIIDNLEDVKDATLLEHQELILEIRKIGLDGVLCLIFLMQQEPSITSVRVINRILRIPMVSLYRNLQKIQEIGLVTIQYVTDQPDKAFYKITDEGISLIMQLYEILESDADLPTRGKIHESTALETI